MTIRRTHYFHFLTHSLTHLTHHKSLSAHYDVFSYHLFDHSFLLTRKNIKIQKWFRLPNNIIIYCFHFLIVTHINCYDFLNGFFMCKCLLYQNNNIAFASVSVFV
jgi:hypothetical protein